MKKQRLLLLGAGQYGHVAKEVAQSMDCFASVDFLDDHHPQAIGALGDYKSFVRTHQQAFVAIGRSELRCALLAQLEAAGLSLATLISPQAYVSPSAQLMAGTIVEPMAVVHTHSQVARGCILSAGAVINHDCQIGQGCHVDCNATVPARSVVPAGTKVNCAEVYLQKELV